MDNTGRVASDTTHFLAGIPGVRPDRGGNEVGSAVYLLDAVVFITGPAESEHSLVKSMVYFPPLERPNVTNSWHATREVEAVHPVWRFLAETRGGGLRNNPFAAPLSCDHTKTIFFG